jgi:hypothetical protein
MITQLETELHIAKTRCDTCARELLLFQDSVITQAVIDLVNSKADQHEHHHPTHNIDVMIWKGAPETLDI